jgi:hypothetical protein
MDMREVDAFPASTIKAEDLELKDAKLTITGVEMSEIGQGTDKEIKPFVSFQGTPKKLVLNKTNFSRIVHVTGEADTDNWAGHHISLYKDMTDFQGKLVPCVRVRIDGVAATQGPQAVQLGPPHPSESTDNTPSIEDIPF